MEDGFFQEDVERVAEAGRRACEAIEATVRTLAAARDARAAGRPLPDVVEALVDAGSREVRLAASEAFRTYEQALNAMRSDVVRVLVDSAGLSLTGVADRLGVSRQSATRLYQAARRRHRQGEPTDSGSEEVESP